LSSPQQPLIALLEQAQAARDEAFAQFESGRRAHDTARQQLQSLHDFRRQYQERWQNQFRQSGGMEIMRCYQDFMTRMADAESEQQRRTEAARVYMERCQAVLLERERKVAAVDKLLDRREKEQFLREQRRDQKATDELAARLYAAARSASSSPLN
jgi:flagellar FliJ protein